MDRARGGVTGLAVGILVAGALALAFPPAKPKAVPNLVEGKTWAIAAYRDGARLIPVYDSTGAVLKLSGGEVHGSPGCGNFDGRYAISGEQLRISELRWVLAGFCNDRDGSRRHQSDGVTAALLGNHVLKAKGRYVLLLEASGQTRIELDPPLGE